MPSSMLQLDLGNTQGKWRLLTDDAIDARGVFTLDALPAFAAELSGLSVWAALLSVWAVVCLGCVPGQSSV